MRKGMMERVRDIVMTRRNAMDDLSYILPEVLEELGGEITGLRGLIGRLENDISALSNQVHQQISDLQLRKH